MAIVEAGYRIIVIMERAKWQEVSQIMLQEKIITRTSRKIMETLKNKENNRNLNQKLTSKFIRK
jgi:flagellar biosynthesis component FlhA